tara:strand:+ start:4161 stop:8552 length:4392 start_codon:yes stop_codon:yes gene_type:complete
MADERLLREAQKAEDTSPGTEGARSKLKQELGFSVPQPLISPLPNELGERTTQIINNYEKQLEDFGPGTPLHGKSAEELLDTLYNIRINEGNSEKLEAAIVAFEEISKSEAKTPILHHIATGFEEAWKGITTGVQQFEQGVVDAVANPMLDLAGIRLTEDGVYVSSPQGVELPEGSATQQLGKGLLGGKGTGWSGLPEERVPLIKIPGGGEPETEAGDLYRVATQAGLSWFLGDKALNSAKALQVAIPKLKSFFSTRSVQNVLNTATGEALTLQQKDRFAKTLTELGVDNQAIAFIAGAPNEDAFTARFKSYLDGALAGMGGTLLIEPFVKLGRAAWNMGFLGKTTEKDPEKAAKLLNESERFINKLLEIVPTVDAETGKFKVSDPLVSLKDPTLEQSVGQLEEIKAKLEKDILEKKPVLDEGEVAKATLTQKDETIMPTGKKPAPMQPEDIKIKDLFKWDIAKDKPTGEANWKINFANMGGTVSAKEIIQRMFIQLENKYPNDLRFGEKGKARKKADGTYVTEGNVLTNEELKKQAGLAAEWMKSNGYSPERFLDGFSAYTEDMPVLMLLARDLVQSGTNYIDTLGDQYRQLVRSQNGKLEPEQQLKFVTEFAKMSNMFAQLRASERDVARTLQAMSIESVPVEKRREAAEAIIRDFTSSLTIKGSEKKLLKFIDKMQGLKTVEQINSLFKKDNFTRIFDLINFNGINAFLSNMSTQTVNTVGSAAMTNLLVSEKMLSAGFNTAENVGRKIIGAEPVEGTTFDESKADMFGVVQSLFESLFIGIDDDIAKRSAVGKAWEGFKELDTGLHQGYDIGHMSEGSTERFLGLKVPEAANAKEVEEAFNFTEGDFNDYFRTVINGTGTIMGLPGRLLMSGDAFFRSINYRRAIHSLAMKRAHDEGLKGAELDKRYRQIVQSLPQDIDEAAQTYAQISLFQQPLDGGGMEKMFKAIENWRKPNRSATGRNMADSLIGNAWASFASSKIPFFRTPYNIFKQTMVERNGMVHGLRWLTDYNDYRLKFKSDAAFRQDVLAKTFTGGLLMHLGYSLGGGQIIPGAEGTKDLLTPEGLDVSITGGSNPSYQGRDIAADQLRTQPEIFIRNMSTYDASTIPIGRADPIASLIMAGAIIGNHEAFIRNHVEPYREIKDVNNLSNALADKNKRLLFHMGNFFMDKAMLRGVRDMFDSVFSPNADPRELLTNYASKYAGQVPLANFFRGLVRAADNHKYYNVSRVKSEFIPTEEGDRKVSKSGFEYPNLTEEKQKQLGIIDKLLREITEEFRKVNILDMGSDGSPIIRPGTVPMVDLEANPIGFNDREANIYERFLEQNLIPFSSKKVNETNTSVLIKNLDINFSHPKRWVNLNVGNEKIPLSPEQQLMWAVHFGKRNRGVFGTKEMEKVVKQLKKDGPALAPMFPKQFLKIKTEIYAKLRMNKGAAKWEMITSFPELRDRYIEATIKNATETMIGE